MKDFKSGDIVVIFWNRSVHYRLIEIYAILPHSNIWKMEKIDSLGIITYACKDDLRHVEKGEIVSVRTGII